MPSFRPQTEPIIHKKCRSSELLIIFDAIPCMVAPNLGSAID